MSNELAVTEWQSFEDFVSKMRDRLHADRDKLAQYLGRMSTVQLGKAKAMLRFLCSADAVEKLAMCGRGLLDIRQAEMPIPARVWRSLPDATRKRMQPELEVEILAARGVVVKPLGKLNALEVDQVIDAKEGPIPAEKQRKLVPIATKREDEAEELESIRLIDGARVLIRGKSGSRILVPTKTLRGILK